MAEDGYCDDCGCIIGGQSYALKLDGTKSCLDCAGIVVAVAVRAKRPEARDDRG